MADEDEDEEEVNPLVLDPSELEELDDSELAGIIEQAETELESRDMDAEEEDEEEDEDLD